MAFLPLKEFLDFCEHDLSIEGWSDLLAKLSPGEHKNPIEKVEKKIDHDGKVAKRLRNGALEVARGEVVEKTPNMTAKEANEFFQEMVEEFRKIKRLSNEIKKRKGLRHLYAKTKREIIQRAIMEAS